MSLSLTKTPRRVWALWDIQAKAFVYTSGYYGTECHILCFKDKESGLRYIGDNYKVRYDLKKVKVV